MTERVPLTILKNLIHNETYTRQVIPFIEPDYFEERTDRIVFEEVAKFLDVPPSLLRYCLKIQSNYYGQKSKSRIIWSDDELVGSHR